ncbi:ankyrin repeat domain-containing protein [Leptospira alexanderi]|uniref:ankyrin repeat domain-containing protein n=1 Tax=Leptospira alexanderi TaxID=100053 RepID=UPI000990DA91|nr:ankyrin repeat domain-containing protein [Leptospira alexanderi]
MSTLTTELLTQAILSGNVEKIAEHLQSGGGFEDVVLESPNGYGVSPLKLAVIAETQYNGLPGITKLILENSTLKTQSEDLLFFASEDAYLDQAKAMLRAGMQPDSPTANQTALQLAVGNKSPKMVHLLLSYGADPNRRGNNGSAFDRAESNPLYEGMLSSALNGNLKSPYYFIDLEKVKRSLNRWADQIRMIVRDFNDQTFYVFGIDHGSLVANTEEKFKKTLEKYQKNYPNRYDREDKVLSLKYNSGDFSFQVPVVPEKADFQNDRIDLDYSFLNPRENENRIEKELLRDGLLSNRDILFKDLNISKDFKILAFGHIY